MTITQLDHVPLVDLRAQHDEVADAVRAAFDRILDATAFVGGPDVAAFEVAFAAYCERRHCIGVANGTDAIEMVLRGLGIGAGDEVVVPTNTFIATAEAVARANARPVLVDCDPLHHLIDPAQVARAITPRTRAVIGVHLFGQQAPMEHVADVVAGRAIALVEDAAQAQGALRHLRPIASWGAAAATSFYPGKNLGAYGDAGAVVTDDEQLAATVRMIGSHGGARRYEHDVIGCNSRLDTLQAAVLKVKLARLDGWNAARRVAAARYDELLGDLDRAGRVTRPATLAGNVHVWHLYVVKVADRDVVLSRLNAAGVGAGIHYPVPVHLTKAFAELGQGRGSFPVAEALADQMISLPMYPHITAAQQARVVEVLTGALS